jgi:YD repeat-containing protein
MLKWFALAVIAVLIPASAVAQMTVGYDALGRVACVRYPNGKMATYSYDPAGNRTQHNVATGATCVSQTVGAPPTLPVDITTTNPSASINSEATATWTVPALGSASDSATLTLVSAATSGGAGSCGTANTTSTQLSFTAPTVAPAGTTRTCNIDYVLHHPSGLQEGGRVTATIQGAGTGSGGGSGGGGGGEDPPPCTPDPHTGMCSIE